MSESISAVYEEGVLKPLEALHIKKHARVRIQILREEDLQQQAEEMLALARASCEGLSEEELDAVESARLDGTRFFSNLEKSE